jgi:hypothetical protein
VLFHKTSPGGCCDCGDEEAWDWGGCCDKHRRKRGDVCKPCNGDERGEEEALNATLQDSLEGEEHAVKTLPVAVRSILAKLISASVKCLNKTAQRDADGTDLGRWVYQAAEEICAINTGSPEYPSLRKEITDLRDKVSRGNT